MQDAFKESAITILVIYKAAAMIITYIDNINYSLLDENELKNSGILDDFIYQTIINLINTCYLNVCKLIKKLLNSLESCLSD